MSDPSEITQASAVVDSAGGPGGIIGAILGALTVIGGLWRIVFGTRKERAEEQAQEDDSLKHAADIALRMADRADEATARHRIERDDYAARMDAMARVIDAMRADIAELQRGRDECERQNEELRREVELQRKAIRGLLRGSTPPSGLYRGEDVLAAMAAQEDDHG